MAKWGEGDPRWIVEERPDATNVNNWHWTEKNATPWSKERLPQLFKELQIERDDVVCNIDALDKVSGEATVNNRKGKLIFFYEWELTLNWTGRLLKNGETPHKGKITIPNLSEENDLNDVEITITIDESNDESETLKQFMYNVGRDVIRQQLGLYIKELKEEYSKDLILPKKGEEGSVPTQQPKKTTIVSNPTCVNANNAINIGPPQSLAAVGGGYKVDVRTLNMTEEFQCNAQDLYNALTKAEMVTAFTRANATVEAIKGGQFALYGGHVQGQFEELVPAKMIAQSWRLKTWPSGHYSNVTIELEETKNTTRMTLKQTGVPTSEYDVMNTNWHRYYWHSIKQAFGFGVALRDGL